MSMTTWPSAVESTVRVLREEIVDGRLSGGERLTELGLSDRLGVSRSTVREALSLLATRGLVETSRRHGTRVVSLGLADVVELYRMRVRIEPLLLERFCERASAMQLREIEGVIQSLADKAQSSEDLRSIYRAADEFNEALIAGAGSWSIANAVRAEHAPLFAFRLAHLPLEVELDRVRGTTRAVRRVIPMLARREARMVGDFSRRAMAEDAAATLRLVRAVRAPRAGRG